MDKPVIKAESMTADALAKRVFAITMIAAVIYVGAIIALTATH